MNSKKKIFSKFTAVFLAVITLLSMFPVMSVDAAGQTVITLKQGNEFAYTSGWERTVVPMTADGKQVFCVEPDKPAPPNGTYRTDKGNLKEIKSTDNKYEMYNKALYYCSGGDGFNTSNSAFKTDTSKHKQVYSGNTPSSFIGNLKWNSTGSVYYTSCSGDNLHYMFTHLLVSYIQCGDSKYKSTMGNFIPYNGYYEQVKELYNSIKAAPNPPVSTKLYMLDIGNSYQQVIIIRNSIRLQLQKSTNNNRAKYTSLAGAKYNIYLNSSCTEDSYFGYITTDENGYGRYGNGPTVDGVNQGAEVPTQKYYCKEVTAPKGFALDDTVYEFKATSSTVDKAVVYKATTKDNPCVKLQLEKSSANPDLTDGNSCYSLKGAKYGIYTDSSCSSSSYYGYIETDTDGYGRFGTASDTNTDSNDKNTVAEGKISGKNIEMGYDVKFYAKEEVAPKGYKIDNTIYEFKDSGAVSSDGIRILRAYSMTDSSQPKDVPENDPMYVFIKKVNATTGLGNSDLAGAEFTMKFYDGLYTDVSEVEELTPLRTWVFKTDEDGMVQYDETYKVSGDALYESSGYPVLPKGTVTIQETKAPTSGKYLINDEIFIRQTTELGEVNADQEPVNPFVVDEVEKSSGLTIKKTSSDGIVKGIWFRVTSDNGYSTDVEITNSSGVVTLSGLDITKSDGSLINYTIEELGVKNSDGTYSIPKRYKYEGPKTVTLESDKNVVVSFRNTAITGKINIVKTSDDGKVDNIWFSVTSSTGKEYKNTTDTNGKLSFSNLPVYDEEDNVISYEVKELGVSTVNKNGDTILMVPYKYVTPDTQTVTLVNNSNPTLGLVKTVYVHNELKTGSLQIVKESDDGVVTGMWFELTSNTGIDKIVQITDPSGTLTINDLPIYDDTAKFVQYTVTELGFYDEDSDSYYLPSYYFKPSSETGLIVYGSTSTNPKQVTVTNNRKYGNIKIVKTADDNYVEGLWFNVKSDNGYDVNIQTDTDGIAETGNVDVMTADGEWINYEITELGIKKSDGTYSIPERYETEDIQSVNFAECADDLAPNKTVTVQRDVSNKLKTANLKVKKTSEDGKVDNITFSVTGNGVDYGNKTSDSSGTVLYENLPVYYSDDNLIIYTVKELGEKQSDGTYKIPYRYKTPETVTKTLTYDSTTAAVTTVSIYNELKRGSVTLYKQDSDGNALTGSQWELYNASDDSSVTLKQTGNGIYQYNDTGKVVILDTDNNGRLKVSNLKQGDYYFIEKTSPDGKMTYGRKIEFTISADSDEMLNLTYTAVDDAIVMYDTGSNGNYSIYFLGFTMLAISIAVVAVYAFKSKRKHIKK